MFKSRTAVLRITVCMVGTSLLLLTAVTTLTEPAAAKGSKYADTSYQILPNSPVPLTSATATIVLPSFTCPSKKSGYAIEFGLSSNSSFGTAEGELVMGCAINAIKKAPVYGWVISAGSSETFQSFTPAAGDTVNLTATCDSGGATFTLDDVTASMTASASSSEPTTCVWWFANTFIPSTTGKMAKFGPIAFSNLTANGSAIGTWSPTESDNYSSKKLAVTSSPLTDGGTAFTTTRGT